MEIFGSPWVLHLHFTFRAFSRLFLCLFPCTDFYDICDEVECKGPQCPESECQCAPGTTLGPDGQTCMGESGGREGGGGGGGEDRGEEGRSLIKRQHNTGKYVPKWRDRKRQTPGMFFRKTNVRGIMSVDYFTSPEHSSSLINQSINPAFPFWKLFYFLLETLIAFH